ncbi:hypothetical protein G2W53_002608 [Senna tora]|uniref:SWIM-type domain-containing protein n=1 Tax=Senna tora TaxID=362788 RepID=A0A834X8V8_9FABA|nr:hypothetical protein G2W53_002608 [Senna tora]
MKKLTGTDKSATPPSFHYRRALSESEEEEASSARNEGKGFPPLMTQPRAKKAPPARIAVPQARSKSMASNELMLVDVDAEYYTDENCDSDVDYHVEVEAIMLDDDVDDPQRRSMRPYSLINEDNPFEGEDKYESEGMENLDELEEDDNHESSNKKRAEHRSCMRHLWVNFSKQHKGLELKKAMWDCAYATNVQQFQRCMQNVKAISESAWSWLDRLDPKVWYRSKPILTLAEEIRCKIMRKICKEREKMLRYHGPITPKVQDKLERDKKASRFWTPQWAGDPEGVRYEVQCSPNKYDVNLVARTCSCMEFDLTGIPCVHAIAAIGWNNLKPEDFVHPYYTKETYLRVYEPYVKPANGIAMWPQAGGDPVMPPPLKRPPGRPKKQRKKEHNETSKPNNVKRRYGEVRCTKCQLVGHNRRTCKGPPSKKNKNSQAGQASQSHQQLTMKISPFLRCHNHRIHPPFLERHYKQHVLEVGEG